MSKEIRRSSVFFNNTENYQKNGDLRGLAAFTQIVAGLLVLDNNYGEPISRRNLLKNFAGGLLILSGISQNNYSANNNQPEPDRNIREEELALIDNQ